MMEMPALRENHVVVGFVWEAALRIVRMALFVQMTLVMNRRDASTPSMRLDAMMEVSAMWVFARKENVTSNSWYAMMGIRVPMTPVFLEMGVFFFPIPCLVMMETPVR